MPKGRKSKYGEPTTMLAVRVPQSLDDKLGERAAELEQPKSDTVVQILREALEELPVAPDLDVPEGREKGVFG